jgi:S1/P1 Nuclease
MGDMKIDYCRRIAAVLAISVGLSPCLMAWDDQGHMMVAALAWTQLSSDTLRARATTLLKLNPDYSKWQSMIPVGTAAKDVPQMIFMIAATWPDAIKSEPGYTNDKTPSAANVGYSDKNQHRYWHYVDTPFTQDGSTLPAVPSPNAETQIAAFRTLIKSTKPDALKSYDLVWLLHLVGDVHQPLHATTRVSTADPKGDGGGNNVKCGSPCPSELHGYWDDLLGTSKNPVPVLAAALALPAAAPVAAKIADESKWIAESFQLAKDDVYAMPIDAGDGPFKLTVAYETKAKTVAQTRVALAGSRLAALINANLK